MKLKRKSQKISENKGITLIVLAITIMVITILATITVNTINIFDLLKYTKLILPVETVKKLEEVYA